MHSVSIFFCHFIKNMEFVNVFDVVIITHSSIMSSELETVKKMMPN